MAAKQIFCQTMQTNSKEDSHTQMAGLHNVSQAILPVAYFQVERRKGGRAKSIKVTVSIIQSVLRWNQPYNTHSLPTAELAFPLFSLKKWLLKWKEILIGCFSLGAFWKGNVPKQFPLPALHAIWTTVESFQFRGYGFKIFSMMCVCVMHINSHENAISDMRVYCTHRQTQKSS